MIILKEILNFNEFGYTFLFRKKIYQLFWLVRTIVEIVDICLCRVN